MRFQKFISILIPFLFCSACSTSVPLEVETPKIQRTATAPQGRSAMIPQLRQSESPDIGNSPRWVRPRLVGWASDSGHFLLDESKLEALFPSFHWTAEHLAYLSEHLDRGDSRAAIVASLKPLVVSAYSDELDAVILVQFPDDLVEQYSLSLGDQLIASWVYPSLRQPPRDIVQGPSRLAHQYNNGAPIIADFFSNSAKEIKQRKISVSNFEWERVRALTPAAVERAGGRYRSAFPLDTRLPPELIDELRVGQ